MMNTQMKKYKESVRQVQVYLYDISRVDGDIPRVNPDGIYGSSTVKAVSTFQVKHGLIPNGRVNYETFKKLSAEHERADAILFPSRSISPFEQALKDGVTRLGDESDLIMIVKIMLKAIGASYPVSESLQTDGIFDADTEAVIKEFQFIQGLPSSGIIDKETWNRLALAYEKHRVPL